MAVVLNTTLKMDGKVYEEGRDVQSLPNKVKKYVKDNKLYKHVVDEEDIELEEEESEDDEETEETESESEEEEAEKS